MALIKIINIAFSLVQIALVRSMVNYKILSNREKHNRFSNMKSRCGKAYQKENPRYNSPAAKAQSPDYGKSTCRYTDKRQGGNN